jgi:hypothetical protein
MYLSPAEQSALLDYYSVCCIRVDFVRPIPLDLPIVCIPLYPEYIIIRRIMALDAP